MKRRAQEELNNFKRKRDFQKAVTWKTFGLFFDIIDIGESFQR